MTAPKTGRTAAGVERAITTRLRLLASRADAWEAADRTAYVARDTAMEYVAQHLRTVREAVGLSLREVARRAGVSATALSFAETGDANRPIGGVALVRICGVLTDALAARTSEGSAHV